MASRPTQVSISFKALLTTITHWLEIPHLEYRVLDEKTNEASVLMKTNGTDVAREYIGGPATTLEGSLEMAAQAAIHNLMQEYDIYVKDVTALRRQAAERCTNLLRLKRTELQRLQKGLSKIPLVEEFEMLEISHLHSVSLDFLQTLEVVVAALPIQCGAITSVEHTPSAFTAWMSIQHHNSLQSRAYMVGDIATNCNAAKQSLAEKVTQYLIPIYNIEVIDANYDPKNTQLDAILCDCIQKKCLSLEQNMQAQAIHSNRD